MAKFRSVQGRTENQKNYIRSVASHQITICHGPAGSGKTHIAAGLAAEMFVKEKVDRIILCRPVVACGQDIGFLPGTVDDKIGPYLAPLFDELSNFLDHRELRKMMSEHTLEIVPLSMMRGRSFHQSFVILDEAQNATYAEFQMLLTRLGQNSKMVLCGDSSQNDLGRFDFNSITNALDEIDEIAIVRLGFEDIVRNTLIRKIIHALEVPPTPRYF